MKIALVVSLFPPKWLGGTEIATYNLAKYLAENGHEVHLITSLDEGLPPEEIKEGFYVHRVEFKKVRFAGIILFWIYIFAKLKKIDPEIIHIQSIATSLPAFFAKKLLKKPYIIWGQGSDVYLPDQFTKLISKIVLKNADAVIALSNNMKTEMIKIYNTSIFIIPNGVDLENIKNISIDKRCINEEKTIIFVGTLRPVKGIKYLIKAMKIINEKSPDTNLVLIGDGSDREELETLTHELNLENKIKFYGRIPNKEIPVYMAKADIFALPSLSEGFPLVIIEAMVSGLPIVTTNVGGLPEIIKNGENGFLVEPMNPKEIADKILVLLYDNDLRNYMSTNNKIKGKKYSWNNVVKCLENIYTDILKI